MRLGRASGPYCREMFDDDAHAKMRQTAPFPGTVGLAAIGRRLLGGAGVRPTLDRIESAAFRNRRIARRNYDVSFVVDRCSSAEAGYDCGGQCGYGVLK